MVNEMFSPAPPKTDSLADYSIISYNRTVSDKPGLTDSDFTFDFGNLSTNDDGTINSSDTNMVASFQKSQMPERLSENRISENEESAIERYNETYSSPNHPQSDELITCTLNGDGDTANITRNDKASSNYGIAKFFTRLRIIWWLLSFIIFYVVSQRVACIVFLLQFFVGNNTYKIISKRTIQWTVENFCDEIKTGLLPSPPFIDKSGQWHIVVVQKECIDGLQTLFGLIVSDLPREVEFVKATIEFTFVNQQGHDICPGYQPLYFQHSFASVGDCSYSRAITLSHRQLLEHKQLHIKCRVEFERQEIGYLKELYKRCLGVNKERPSSQQSIFNAGKSNSMSPAALTFGSIFQQKDSDKHNLKNTLWRGSPTAKFVQHPETKTFVWEIPNFRSLVKNAECWGLFSPQLFVNSHDFCSIWRLKFFELLGVFRLHVQLRGLPGAIKQVKTWHLVTLVDNYGDHIVPDECNPRLKYPDYLNLWHSHRHILYRREIILDRFVSNKGTLTIRISLQVEPNELVWMEGTSSDGWILT